MISSSQKTTVSAPIIKVSFSNKEREFATPKALTDESSMETSKGAVLVVISGVSEVTILKSYPACFISSIRLGDLDAKIISVFVIFISINSPKYLNS